MKVFLDPNPLLRPQRTADELPTITYQDLNQAI